MKGTKWLSCLLTFALLAGLLVALPVLPEAAAASIVVGETDFEDGGTIYPDPSALSAPHYGFNLVKESGNDTNTVLTSSELRGATWDWPAFLTIPAKTGESKWLQIEKGTVYTVSLSYKATKSFGNDLKIGLRFLALGSDGNAKNPGSLNSTEIGHGKYQELATIPANTEDFSWKTVKANVQLPDGAAGNCLCLSVYNAGNGGKDNSAAAYNAFYIDNIVVTCLQKVEATAMNFDSPEEQAWEGSQADWQAGVEITAMGDDHGNAAKMVRMDKNQASGAWPKGFKIYDNAKDDYLHLNKGTVYTLQFDTKGSTLNGSFSITLRFYSSGLSSAGVHDSTNSAVLPDTTNVVLYTISAPISEWTTISVPFELPADMSDEVAARQVCFIAHSNGSDSQGRGYEFYFDNIKILRDPQITVHENNGDAPYACALSAETETAADLPVPVLPCATFEGWYTDEQLTTPAEGALEDGMDLYAKWNTAIVNGDTAENDNLLKGGSFARTDGIGVDGSVGFIMTGNESNWTYFPNLLAYNPDGSYFHLVPGHKYKLTLDYKPSEDKAFHAQAMFYLANKADNAGSSLTSYAQESPTSFPVGEDGFRHATLEMTATSNGYLYIVAARFDVKTIFDNVLFVDETAQLAVTVDGEEVKGYAGDPIPVQSDDTAAAHDTVVGVSGTPKHFWKADESYTKESAQFAVTGASADGKTLYLCYNDLLYLAADGSVKAVAVRNDSSDLAVKKIGVLLGDSADLTVGSASEGELQILDYNNEGSLFAGVAITAGQTARPYVETTDGTILYGEARTPLAGAFGEISAQAAYTPLDDVFAAWDFDESGTVTDADGVAALRGLLLDGGAEDKGDLTGGGRDICDLVYLNAVLNNAPSYTIAE